jgi:hypothetical protein
MSGTPREGGRHGAGGRVSLQNGSHDEKVKQVAFFDQYNQSVCRMLGGPLSSKSFAIELSRTPRRQVEVLDRLCVPDLMAIFATEDWAAGRGKKNWGWREVPPHVTTTPEVDLERRIAALDPTRWSCQMPTCSGIEAGRSNGRRAIDLVHRIAPDEYGFIELKVEDKQPLFAAFEILGYALTYLQAREAGVRGKGDHDVMSARKIELCVLAPASYYEYKLRGGDRYRFEFAWLARAIVEQLNRMAPERLDFDFQFRHFPKTLDASVVQRACSTWWG